jgi:glycosyltransferase involved in cell wall biosynthesis
MLRRIVFPLDQRFRRGADGLLYSDRGVLPWDRYLAFAQEITVVSRPSEPADSTEHLSLASHPQVSFLEVPNLSHPLARLANYRTVARTVRGALADADAVVARLPGETASVAIGLAERMRIPYAVEVVACTWDALWNYGNWQGKAWAPYSWWRTRRLVRGAPFVLYVTREFLQRRYPSNGRTAAVSDVEVPELDPDVLRRRLTRIASRPRPFVIGTIGALSVRYKGFETAFAALADVRSRLPELQFRILGAGDPGLWREEVERRGLDDVVVFSGTRRPGADVAAWLDDVDLYVQPSFQEGLPRAVVEALARACPVLGSTAGGIPELVAADSLHAPGDVAGLARLLAARVADRDWQEREARRSFELAQTYEATTLDAARTRFYEAFVETVSR